MEAAGEMKGDQIKCGRKKKRSRREKVVEKRVQRERDRRQ